MGEGQLAIMTNDQSLLDIGSVNIAHDGQAQAAHLCHCDDAVTGILWPCYWLRD